MIKITGYKTFGKKSFKIICNTRELLLVNVFGFGLWVYGLIIQNRHGK